jgi:hypothetical protein
MAAIERTLIRCNVNFPPGVGVGKLLEELKD